MKEVIIGIDLGTTNSCVSFVDGDQKKVIFNKEGKNTTPSVVAFGKNNEIIVGEAAKRMAATSNVIYEAKRLIGRKFKEINQKDFTYKIVPANNEPEAEAYIEIDGKKYSPIQISSYILSELKKSAESSIGEGKIKKAVITVPAYFNDSQRQATKLAGEIAGLEVVRIINEPTAAAIAYGLENLDQSKKIAIYDLGGGTFDVSILEMSDGVFEVLSTNGNTLLGGSDFDKKIVDYLLKTFKEKNGFELTDPLALQRIKEAAESAKIQLSSTITTTVNLPYLTAQGTTPIHLSVDITRSKLEDLCNDLIQQSLEPCKIAMKDAKISVSDISEVILVGGMTRMPKIQEVVKSFFGREPHKGMNPDEVVAIGAGIQGGVLSGDVKDVVLLDVTPLTLGIETMGGVMTPLITKNTTIPTKKSQVFSTASDNQPQVHIRIFQGERPMAESNKFLGDFVLDGIPNAPKGVPQIEVTFELDSNGILNVTAKDKGTNKEQAIQITSSSGLSKEEIERMIKEAEENAEEDKKRAELINTKNQAESLINSVEKNLKEHGDKLAEEEKKKIEESLERTKNALTQNNADDIKNAVEDLTNSSMKLGEIIYKQNQEQQQNNNNSNTEETNNSNT